jgi:soluble lytic murein transglycosylase-like protein
MGTTKLQKVLALSLLAVTAVTAQACRADCFDAAAHYQKVRPVILRGIAKVESQDNPHAINHNKNGSVDYGMMQINSIHLKELKKYGVHKADLMNACKNIYTAAWLYRQKVDLHGDNWVAVGSYHSETPRERWKYARKVQLAVQELAYEERIQLAANN